MITRGESPRAGSEGSAPMGLETWAVTELTVARLALIRTRRGSGTLLAPFPAYHQGCMTANADKAVRPTSPAGVAAG